MKNLFASLFFLLASCGGSGGNPTPPPAPLPAQTWAATNGVLTVGASSLFGGAVSSITDAANNQYVNIADHGREFQAAYQLDGYTADGGQIENPTEAGSASDTASSSSVVISASAVGNVLSTCNHPAYWEPYNGAVTSSDTICKTVTLGYKGNLNILVWDTSITTIADHTTANIETLTGYTPPFPNLWTLEPDGSYYSIANPSAGFTQYPAPIIEASADGSEAVGIYSPTTPNTWIAVNITGANVSKWDCNYIAPLAPLPAGTYNYRCFVAIGTLPQVEAAITALKNGL